MNLRLAKYWNMIFWVFIYFIWIIHFILQPYITVQSSENRNLEPFPQFSENLNFKDYNINVEKYYNDHLPFRDPLLKLNTLINFYLFKDSTSDKVIIGKENWLFYLGQYESMNTISNYKGLLKFSEDEKFLIACNLKKANDYFSSRNIKFITVIPPDKVSVYSDYLPDYIRKSNNLSRTDNFLEYINEKTELKIIYPKATLINNKDKYQLYYKYDTHWNQIGAYLACCNLVRQLYNINLTFDNCKIIGSKLGNQNINSKDLAGYLNLKEMLNDDFDYKVKVVGVEKFDQKILIIGDSFSDAMVPILEQIFNEVILISDQDYTFKDINLYNPDIVIYEQVERRLEDINDFNIFSSKTGSLSYE